MCGICGVVNFRDEPVEEPVLQAMTRRLKHRGPDTWAVARPSPNAGLGHTRLKVIDLSDAANQPMANDDGSVWIIYNGEVYNYQSLRAELEQKGLRFRSRSDTEVILRAYEAWGKGCVERLDGMFALAILDRKCRQLLLARDRTGKKPLYYQLTDTRILFASEIKALLVHPSVSPAFDVSALPLYLAYGYVPQPATFYQSIQSLPPATWMLIDLQEGKMEHRHYWQLKFPFPAKPVKRAEAIEGIRQRMTQAVQKRLISDVPLGAFLSGGIDSTIVVGLMSKLRKDPIHTFSIGFRGDARFDETSFARLAATAIGSKHTEFVVKPAAFELARQLVYHHDQPFGDASAIPTFLLCQLAKEHVSVALNGDGGDECFGGYRRFQAAVISAAMPPALSSFLLSLVSPLSKSLPRFRKLAEARRFLDAARKPWEERLARWVCYFSEPNTLLRPEHRRRIPEDAWLESAQHWLNIVYGHSPLSQALFFNFQEYLPGDLNVKMDRCSMAHGLETRSPFLDTEVIEYAAALPDNYKLTPWRTKILLKEAFRDLLPPRIFQRGKWGFGVPLDAWFRNDLREVVSEMLLSKKARIADYLDTDKVKGYYEQHLSGERNWGLQLWNLLTLELWLGMMQEKLWTNPAEPSWVAQKLTANYGN